MQFRCMPGKGTTDATFMERQMQEKFVAKERVLYFTFVDLEKAFDRVPTTEVVRTNSVGPPASPLFLFAIFTSCFS